MNKIAAVLHSLNLVSNRHNSSGISIMTDECMMQAAVKYAYPQKSMAGATNDDGMYMKNAIERRIASIR
jgi:hypothetical protein